MTHGHGASGIDWLNEQQPHDPARSQSQIDGLLALLARPPKAVLDLGCGIGRVLIDLAAAGHLLTGIDRDAGALAQCHASLQERNCIAELISADFTASLPSSSSSSSGKYDAVLCLGNTFMTVADVDQAVDVLQAAGRLLTPQGLLAIDDFPHELWPELTEGNWLSGISEDGQTQLVWRAGDAVFALRHGRHVDPHDWTIRSTDTTMRLWCEGSLRLAARAAGMLSAPQHIASAGLIVMRRLAKVSAQD